jgi:hypothetical protein
MKDEIEDKRDQRIFDIIDKVTLNKLVDEFIEELGKRDDKNAQWFAIRWDLTRIDKKTSRVLMFIVCQLFVISIAILSIATWILLGK